MTQDLSVKIISNWWEFVETCGSRFRNANSTAVMNSCLVHVVCGINLEKCWTRSDTIFWSTGCQSRVSHLYRSQRRTTGSKDISNKVNISSSFILSVLCHCGSSVSRN